MRKCLPNIWFLELCFLSVSEKRRPYRPLKTQNIYFTMKTPHPTITAIRRPFQSNPCNDSWRDYSNQICGRVEFLAKNTAGPREPHSALHLKMNSNILSSHEVRIAEREARCAPGEKVEYSQGSDNGCVHYIRWSQKVMLSSVLNEYVAGPTRPPQNHITLV